jgi:hypothetical protein
MGCRRYVVKKENTQKVDKAARQAPGAIFGIAELARIMGDRHLGDPEPLPVSQHRDVAMQFSI